MSKKLGKDIDKVLNTQVVPKKTLVSKWCTPTGTKVMDVLHGISLLAVLATALWNLVLTTQNQATIVKMIPVFITTLIAAIIKIPSQVCAAQGRLGGWMSVAGSVVTVIITAVMIGYLTFDPVYANDVMEDVCVIVGSGSDQQCHSSILESSKINDNGTSCNKITGKDSACSSTSQSNTSLRRGKYNNSYWSPIFHA